MTSRARPGVHTHSAGGECVCGGVMVCVWLCVCVADLNARMALLA